MNLPVTAACVEFARNVEALLKQASQQVRVPIEESLHNGVYVRTGFVPPGVIATGCLTKVPTTLIVIGKCKVSCAEGVIDVDGFACFETAAGRKTVFRTITKTVTVMIFKTDARTTEEARRAMTDDVLLGE